LAYKEEPLKENEKPVMTTSAGRPIKVLNTPSEDIFVQCRTAQGEDVHVPLKALVALIEKGIAKDIRENSRLNID
jgi:hypothetical protein